MFKRLLTLCAVALVGLAVMANPEEMQKKHGKKVAPRTTVSTGASVLSVLTPSEAVKPQPKRNAVQRDAQRKPLQVAAKSAAKAPAWVKASAPAPDDTIDIALGDLPFSYSGKTGDAAFGRIFRIIADADTSIMLGMVMDKVPGMYAAVFDVLLGNPLVFNDEGLGRIDVVEHDTLLLRLDYNISYPNEAFTFTLNATGRFVDYADSKTYTLDSIGVPFKVAGAEMLAEPYYICVPLYSPQAYYPLGHLYKFVADEDTTYVLKGTELVDVTDPANPIYLGPIAKISASKGDILTIGVVSSTSTYDFEVYKGNISFEELYNIPCSKITLPFEESNVLNTFVDYFGAYARTYKFTLSQKSKVRLFVAGESLYMYELFDENESTYSTDNCITLTALEAGTYYACVTGGAQAEYDIFIEALDEDYKSSFDYFDIDYSQQLTLDETIYSKASFAHSPFVDTPSWGGLAQGYNITLQPGIYTINSTVRADVSDYVDCGLFLFREEFDSIYSNDLIRFENASADVKCTASMTFEVTEATTYRIAMLSWPNAADAAVNFSLVVEPYAPEHYTARTIPYTVKGDFADGALPYSSSYVNGLSFVYVPQDTILEISGKASAYNASSLYVNVGTEDDNLGTYNDGYLYIADENAESTCYVRSSKGYHYISYEASGYSGETFDYEYSVKYCDKTLVKDVITIQQLLAEAPQATLNQKQKVELGFAPSKLVAGNSGYAFGDESHNYYTMAYKLQADSGKVLLFSVTDNTATISSYVYEQKADTIVYVNQSAYYPIDSTTTYYVVVRTNPNSVGIANINVKLLDEVKNVTIDSLLASVTTVTPELKPTTFELNAESAAVVEGEDDRFRWSGDQYFAVAYKAEVDSGKVICVNYAGSVDNYLEVYIQLADTIVRYSSIDDCVAVGIEADTTTTYYLVFTTYSRLAEGKITISYSINSPVAYEDLLATAQPLIDQRGKLNFGTPVYVPQEAAYVWVFEAYMDSLQVYNTNCNGWAHMLRMENGEYVSCENYNSMHILFADSAATYYLMYTYDRPTITYPVYYEFSRPAETMYDYMVQTQLPLVVSDTLNQFSTTLYSSDPENLGYVGQAYSFGLNKNDMVGMISFDNENRYQQYMILDTAKSMPVLQADVSSSNTFVKATVSDTANYAWLPFISMNDVYNYGDHTNVNVVVNYIYPDIDSLLRSHMADPVTALPLSVNGKMCDLLVSDWYVDGGSVSAADIAKINGKSGERYTISSNNEFGCHLEVYYFKDGAFTKEVGTSLPEGKQSRTVTLSVDADYYFLLSASSSVGNAGEWYDNYDASCVFSLFNSTQVIEIKDIVADCDYITVDNLNEMLIKDELEKLTIYAVTTGGAQIAIENTLKRWNIDAEFTEAIYAPRLDKALYKWAANADSVTHVLINPVKVSASAGEHGEISPSGTKRVRRNSQVTYTITADQGYVISKILVNGDPVSADCLNKREGEYRFKATKNTSIEVEFKSTSAVSETEMINTVVYGRDRMIIVDGAEENSDIRIFTLTGSVIYAGRITSTYEQYNVPASGLYIVRIADKATKVIVK